ncbi:MAG: heme lyase CcmF/NrfE family subunit, partial [Acidimicrobiaceae bacterium]|nr:heme lyase CcmF/NrfE family subunit [Acidimicrobiaceae bacterium]
ALLGLAALGVSLVAGASGVAPLLAFGLGGFAAGSALRHLIRAVRVQRLRGFVGRANGGMIVHLGVILICVALAASNSFTRSQEIDLVTGQVAKFAGHTFELIDVVEVRDARSTTVRALVSVDGGQQYSPSITKYTRIGMNVGTPSVRTSFTHDVYLTLEPPVRQDSGQARIKVFVKPLVLWMWIGTFVMAFGTLLAVLPTRRRSIHEIRDEVVNR